MERIRCRLIPRPGPGDPDPQPGDMWWDADLAGRWDSEAHTERGGGPHLVVRLPNGWDWDIDGPMSNGPGWERAGEPPHITVAPSIVAGDYHGVLRGGELVAIVDDPLRRYPRAGTAR